VKEAVGEIAGGSTYEEREAREGAPSDGLTGDQQPSENGDEGKRQSDKRDAEQRRFGIGEHAEGDAGIDAVNYVHEVVNDFVPPADWRIWCFDTHFCAAVEGDDDERSRRASEAGGKVMRISLTSEIEERSLHYEPANLRWLSGWDDKPFCGLQESTVREKKEFKTH